MSFHVPLRGAWVATFAFVWGAWAGEIAGSPTPGGGPVPEAVSGFSGSVRRAVRFLSAEVPSWPKENGCFSCHNNGDGARALMHAVRHGMTVEAGVLSETLRWLSRPDAWPLDAGDPAASDRRLADLQFALAASTAYAAGAMRSREALGEAGRRVVTHQGPGGAWEVEPENPVGSPATYGTALATALAVGILHAASDSEFAEPIRKARAWMEKVPIRSTPAAAAVLLWPTRNAAALSAGIRGRAVSWLLESQGSKGGWGPFRDVPAEAFDTALAVLALGEAGSRADIVRAMERGREYLEGIQEPDGGWPATTRPSGEGSYAQRISTSAWATWALLTGYPGAGGPGDQGWKSSGANSAR